MLDGPSEASERTLLVTKSASLLYEIRTTRFFRMPKGEVNKVCWSLKTFYSAFVSLLVGVENVRSNGYYIGKYVFLTPHLAINTDKFRSPT